MLLLIGSVGEVLAKNVKFETTRKDWKNHPARKGRLRLYLVRKRHTCCAGGSPQTRSRSPSDALASTTNGASGRRQY